MNAASRYYERRRELYNNARNKPCTDCGNTYPLVCMDLHHIDPSTKLFAISQFHSKGYDAIKAEIAKCVPLCANCHRIRTHANSDMMGLQI